METEVPNDPPAVENPRMTGVRRKEVSNPLATKEMNTISSVDDPRENGGVENASPDEEEPEDDEAEDQDDAECEEVSHPKQLEEGFYEIEAVRRKRFRKGQAQYLIKWRGWPEAANTWEPIENLVSCSDVIEDFEDGLKSGRYRRRKRKIGGAYAQIKRQKQRVTPVRSQQTEPVKPPTENKNSEELPTDPPDPNKDDESQPITENPPSEISAEQNPVILDRIVENGSPAMKETSSEEQVQEEHALTEQHDEKTTSIADDRAENGFSNVGSVDEQGQTSRCIGSRRRKAGCIRRITQDLNSNLLHENAPNIIQTRSPVLDDSVLTERTDDSLPEPTISEIIKPISYSTSSDNTQAVSVAFLAMRSDGMEVIVDNKFLKSKFPLLLIDYYEQHLRYSPPPRALGV